MIGPRLKTVAQMVPVNEDVLDIGTDHAYLPIYLEKHNISKNIIASDISQNALNQGIENIKKNNCKYIRTIASDGFKNVDEKPSVVTISGMGTSKIIEIIENAKYTPADYIICSHRGIKDLRKFMLKKYHIIEERAVYDSGKWYIVIHFKLGKKPKFFYSYEYGNLNNKEYLEYLYEKKKTIAKQKKGIKKMLDYCKIMVLKFKI